MQLFSSPKSQFPPLFPPPPPNPNPNPNTCRSLPRITVKSYPPFALIKTPPCSSKGSSPPPLQEQILCSESEEDDEEDEGEEEEVKEGGKKGSEGILTVRRPVMEVPKLAVGSFAPVMEAPKEAIGSLVEFDGSGDAMDWLPSSSKIDLGLSEFAKKMPIFEPGRVGVAPEEKPLGINLELGLYRAKVLARKFEFKEAKKILCKCILFWPEDGRAYVALGKLLSKQLKFAEARSVYERGCQATQGENPYIWQCWAVLENKVGNIRRARELFDAATVADKKHVAAWHGWAVLEIKQGNIKNARNLLGKALKYCGGNEYIYQTLALLEAKGNRFEHARYLFRQATLCNPKSCASWLAWAQVEMQQENNHVARKLFEKAVQASPKNRFAWHVWAIFEASQGDIAKGRKLLKIGHALNPRDPVLLQSLALLEYKQSSANLARTLFRRASELDPRHQPVWMAWGWMEWKEGNISIARELYQRALSVDSTTESAARCIQAWGVLEQRLGNLSAARRLFRSSLNVNSQSYVTWMTWASLEAEQGNGIRAEEIRNMYFQQRTEVVDDASWVMGILDIIDPALDSIKRLLNLDQNPDLKGKDILRSMEEKNYSKSEASSERVEEVGDLVTEKKLTTEASVNGGSSSSTSCPIDANSKGIEENTDVIVSDFDVDAFVKHKLSLDTTKLDAALSEVREPRKINYRRRVWRSKRRTLLAQP